MYGDYKVKDIYKSETPKNAQITEAKYTQSISKNSEMDIKSRRYELAATKNGFIPYDITVNALDTIELDFIAVDGDYDLTIPFLGTSFNAVKKGDKKRFTFQITNTGVFAFQCNQFCPEGKIIKPDVVIAKNYLTKDELESLGRIVNAYLDLAENRAKRKIPMSMEDWAKRLDQFLEFDERAILQDKGRISAEVAKEHAESEFEKYRITQDRLFESDFDKEIKAIEDEMKKKDQD